MKKKLVSTIDFTVTGVKFDVILNFDTEIAKTVPCPKKKKMADYYRSTKYHSHNKPSELLISFLYNCVQKFMFKNITFFNPIHYIKSLEFLPSIFLAGVPIYTDQGSVSNFVKAELIANNVPCLKCA